MRIERSRPLLISIGFAAIVAVGAFRFGHLSQSPPVLSPLVHFAPAEDLEQLDVAALDRATHRIDMAAYLLTDEPVTMALDRAARRGVAVRILFDRGQLELRPESPALIALQNLAGVGVRVKTSRVLMHLKAYAVDNRWLRVGSANFSRSGLREQDNEMVILDDAPAAKRFEATFEHLFAAGGTD